MSQNHSLKFKYPSQKDKARINRGEEDNESELQAKCLTAMKDNDTVRKYGEPPAKFVSSLEDNDTVRIHTEPPA